MDTCKVKLDKFCFLCGKHTPTNIRKIISERLQNAYELYYGIQLTRNVLWAPSYSCERCARAMYGWLEKIRRRMPFRTPMIWMNPGAHSFDNCYACKNNIYGINRRTRSSHAYIGVDCAQLPQLYDDDDDDPPSPPQSTIDEISAASVDTAMDYDDESYVPPGTSQQT